MAVTQTEIAVENLTTAEDASAAKAVHEARKCVKRTRAIVRLLEGELGHETYAREQASLRAAAAGLAGARDAEVLSETLDALVGRHRKKLGRRKGVARLRRRLAAERDGAERALLEPANRLRVASELQGFAARAGAWRLESRSGIDPVEAELKNVYAEGRRRMAKATGKRGGRMATMHRWRKRVKDLRYSAEALQRRDPARAGRKRTRSARATKAGRWLANLAHDADELGELLGEEHDLAVLGQWISEHCASAGAGRSTQRKLHKLIRRRRAKLRRRALRRGKALYKRGPRKFIVRVARAHSELS